MRGRPDRRPIAPGSVIEGRPPVDLGATAESAQTVIPNANRTLEDLSKASQQWTTVGERATRIMDMNEKELNVILQQSRESVERLNRGYRSVPTLIFPDGSVMTEPRTNALVEKLQAFV